MNTLSLPYTICFCLWNDQVLMLYRNRPPNKNYWNGVGGKIHEKETPTQAVIRETEEETGIILGQDIELYYGGIVSWNSTKISESRLRQGMYVYIASLPSDYIFTESRQTEEGILEWKLLDWVCAPDNTTVVSNISQFLPSIFLYNVPLHYVCTYENDLLQNCDITSLPSTLR